MNKKLLVKISNTIGIVSIIALVLWVFIFVCTEVFGFKVFRENITDTFAMSILGILALMTGALIINIMLNLTRIAEKHNQDNLTETAKKPSKLWWSLLLVFPLIFFLLWSGDYLTAKKKENLLIVSAKSIVENDTVKSNKLVNYSFTIEWLRSTEIIINLYAKADTHFPHISVLVADTINNSNVILGFSEYSILTGIYTDKEDKQTKLSDKTVYIHSTTKEERDYLNSVFYENNDEIRFNSHNGNYELFYPYRKIGKIIVLYFSDYQRYGKIGS
jgi:hypothetical protein